MLATSTFAHEIELMCRDLKIEYIDAVILWCERNAVEVESAAAWIKKDQSLKSKLQLEAENLNILKKGSRLPL